MADEFGTRDVLGQVDSRLGNVEQDLRTFRQQVGDGMQDLRREANALRTELTARLESQTRWLVGLIFASWITVIASIWLKP